MIKEANVLGSMCLNMIRISLAPMARLDSTYGISLMLSATERTTRVMLGVNTITSAAMTLRNDEPNAATRAIASSNDGKAVRASMKRCTIRSNLPTK